jgi:hypothetical protein
MMRAERAPEIRTAPDPAWLLDSAPEPEVLEAPARWMLPRDTAELSRSD